jgi:glucokinase
MSTPTGKGSGQMEIPASAQIVARLVSVDIGGTHARFCLAEIDSEGQVSLGEPCTLLVADHASFESAWERFAAVHERRLPNAAALSIAGRVANDVIRFTNNPWTIHQAHSFKRLGVEHSIVVNDFCAVGHAVALASAKDFLHLAGPDVPLPDCGTLSVVGPGTGLGVAHVWREGSGGYRVQPTEGGHMDFAPLDTIEDALLMRLRQRHHRVSTERVVSGPAIVDLYETLAGLEGRAIRRLDDRTLWELGISGKDSLAAAAVERFCLSLGSVAGDIALAQGSSGVVIAGGLGLRLRDTLLRSGFAERFRAKGRFEQMMASMPVKIIIHPQLGLLGAAAAFAETVLA